MTTLIKTVPARVESLTERGTGVARVTSLDIDADNERFAPDAFTKQDGAVIPVSYQHALAGDPSAIIGTATLDVRSDGVYARFRLDLDGINGDLARFVYERMKLPASDERALHEFSVGFAFDPAATSKGPDGERVFAEAEIIEVSVVHQGSQDTKLLELKRAPGRTFSSTDAKVGRASTSEGAKNPWRIQARGGRFCVVLERTGESVQCYDNRVQAERLLAALEANADEGARTVLEERFGAELVDEVLGPRKEIRWAREREKRSRRLAFDQLQEGLRLAPKRVVRVDALMRPYIEEEVARDAERESRENAERARRDAEREREADERERVEAARVRPPGITHDEDGTVTYAP